MEFTDPFLDNAMIIGPCALGRRFNTDMSVRGRARREDASFDATVMEWIRFFRPGSEQ